jgi:two-component system, OmpR family, sensor histidine kinase TctE
MTRKPASSLRTKLLYPLLWMWLVPGVIATLSAFWLAGQAARNAFDRVLKDDALVLAAQVKWSDGIPGFYADADTAASLVFDSVAPSRFTVRTGKGRILVGNAELLPPEDVGHAMSNEPVFYDVQTRWGNLRTVALHLQGPSLSDFVWVIVGEAQSKRDLISHELAVAIFLPAAGVGFVLVPLLFFGIRRGLAPAREIVAAVTARGINDLSPLPLENVPDELWGLIERLNDLFARLSEAIAHERRFIADAAHQLRTPTAGIKLLAEDLLRSYQHAPGQPPDTEVLRELHAAALRTSELVRQLLALARAERDPSLIERSTFDVATLLRQVVERWQQVEISQGKRIIIDPDLPESTQCLLHSNPTLLEEALGNILENALLYGGAEIQVSMAVAQGMVRIHMLDNGEALDAETRANLFVPFWRSNASKGPGTGLGLAIAQRTLHSLGGDITVRTRPEVPGNCFTLSVPCPQPDAGSAEFAA